MGRIVEKVKIINLFDDMLAQQGMIESNKVRSLETEVLVDTGATFLCLRKSLIEN